MPVRQAIHERLSERLGKYDFSAHASISNTAAPGDLIRTTPDNKLINMTDIIIYNAAQAASVITFYDEDSNIKLVLSVGAGETADLDLKSSIVYGEHHIYARTDQAVNAEITIAGKERHVST
jgi:hypothetical protein